MFNRNFVLCLVVQLWFMLAFHMTTPQIAQFVVSLGETTALAGFIAGIFSLMALVFRPFSGYAANRFYRKYVLAFGYVVSIASYMGYALAPNAYFVLAFRILHALGLCIQTTVMAVIAMDFIPKERIAEGVSWTTIASTLGMGFGPLVGVWLSGMFGHRGAFFLSGVVMVFTLVLLFVIPVQHHESSAPAKLSLDSFVSVRSLPLTISVLAFTYCSGLTTALIILVGDVRGIAGVAAFFLIASVGMALVRPFSGKLVDKKGLPTVMPFTFAAETICMLLVAFGNTLATVMAAGVFRIFGQGVAQSSLQGQVMKEIPASERGTANATFYMGIDVGQGAGAIIGGIVADGFSFTATFLTGPLVLVIGLATYVYWLRNRSKSIKEGAAHDE